MINEKRSKSERSEGLRLLTSLCSLLSLVSIIAIMISGFGLISTAMLTASLLGIVVPVVIAAEGIAEAFVGFFEAILEGVSSILEFIGDLFSGFS